MITMVSLSVLLGLATAALLNWLSDILPRFSPNAPADTAITAWWRSRRGQTLTWDSLLPLANLVFTAFAFGLMGAKFGLSWRFAFFTASFGLLMLIALIDLKYRLVLNVVIYPLSVIIVMGQACFYPQDMVRVLLGGGIAFGVFFLTAFIKPGQLGGGDIKLATLIGLAFGFPDMLWALLVGGGVGAIMALLFIVQGKGKTFAIPYAPFLCFGAMIALLVNPFAGLM